MDVQDRRHSVEEKEDIATVAPTRPVIDTFGLLVFFVVVVEIALVIGLNLYQKSRIKTLGGQLQSAQATLASPENATINDQINQVLDGSDKLKTVLAQKVHWSKFYTLLDAVTPKNVKLTGLSVSESGSFQTEGTTGTLSDLAQLLVAWKSGSGSIATPFTSADLSGNGFSDLGGQRVVTFTISGQINMGALK